MKEDFLKNLKVGDQALPKEIVDAILAENARDVEAAKAPYADYDTVKDQLKTAKESLKALEGADVQQLQGQITKLQNDLTTKENEHKAQLAQMAFDRALESAIAGANGRNAKAIKANLDLEALKASKNQEADIKTALEGLKKSDAYLFGSDETPPPYAAGTGTGGVGGTVDGVTAAFAKLNPGLNI